MVMQPAAAAAVGVAAVEAFEDGPGLEALLGITAYLWLGRV